MSEPGCIWDKSAQPTSSISIARAFGTAVWSHFILTAPFPPPLCFPSIQIGLCPLPSSLHLRCSLVIPVTPTLWTIVSLQPSPYPKLWPHIAPLFAYLFFQACAGIQDSTYLRLSYSLLSIRDGFHCLALLPPLFSHLRMHICLMFGDLHLRISLYSHFPIPALLWVFASSLTILSHQYRPQLVPFFFFNFLARNVLTVSQVGSLLGVCKVNPS